MFDSHFALGMKAAQSDNLRVTHEDGVDEFGD